MADWPRYRDDAAVNEPAVTLEAFLAQPEAVAVRIEPGADVRELVPHLARLKLVEIGFPTYRDGRGYSAARILREEGYQGELRAEGDVLLDQLAYMRRCGFDSFAPAATIDAGKAVAAIGRWPYHYQKAADGLKAGAAPPIWALRHG
ncbi:DUF934 domain-containing protein [Pacificimonas flava]|uniref:Oxidoreductase probably involved in sulfite reduction n=1 Tax=Pacificimonas flava TaxID=1234595 RepID=M2U2I6_9SPHN|nr:DUF934 domain-containing protein [Pacificimonas flava]EMD82038.1 Oxidoreductase probably involved in sulfite reduction [Pacificimonas flava]MBB5280879.1 uncharacterized protein (DUF934 family) [Pacificimonas flava]